MKLLINRVTPENIVELKDNEIFVFGSNEAGRHGAGAAKFALQELGAKMGVGVGFTGQCYAIPTKDKHIKVLPLSEIKIYVDDFIIDAKENPHLVFLVTKVGCGLAGYKPEDIAPLFVETITVKNIYLPQEFWECLEK